MLFFFLRCRRRGGSCRRYFQWIGIRDTDYFCETAIVLFITNYGFVNEFAAKMDIDPPAGFDSFFIVLSDTGDRKSYGISFFCNDNECIGSKFFYFSLQCAIFQRGFVMIFVPESCP